MKLKKIVSFFLACILAMTYCAAIGNAEQYAVTEQQIEPRYSDFAVIGANLTKADNGLYSAAGSAGAVSSTKTIYITVTIEKLNMDTVTWSTVKHCTWTNSGVGVVTAGGKRSISGGIFRAHTVAKIYDANGKLLETVSAVSKSLSL